MPGPPEPRTIVGSDFVATVLTSVEVSGFCAWAVPDVKLFVALRGDLLVMSMATTRAIKLCLLVIEPISLKHCIIELWENPLCFGYNPGVLTSKGRNNGHERMRIIFAEASAVQDFMSEVERIVQTHHCDCASRGLETRPANHTYPAEAGAAMAIGTPTASGQAAESTSEPLNKGHSIPASASQETNRLPPLHGTSCSATVTSDQVLLSAQDALHRLATAISQLTADRVEDRRIQTEDRHRLEATIADLTATVAALKEDTGRNPFRDMSPLDVLQVAQHALSSLLLVNEVEDATPNGQRNGLLMPLDSDSQELRAFCQSVKDLMRGVEVATESYSILSPEMKKHYRGLSGRRIPFLLHPSPPSFSASRTVAPNVPQQIQHAKRQGPEVSSPPASKRPRPGQTSESSDPAMTLLMHFMASNKLTTVRFGKVPWAADVHQLRAQVYIVGKAAWDSVTALYATLRGVSRDEEEPEYACLEFPAHGLGKMFVEAWETHREQTEVWAEVQAWIA